jgi:hypothetical protein
MTRPAWETLLVASLSDSVVSPRDTLKVMATVSGASLPETLNLRIVSADDAPVYEAALRSSGDGSYGAAVAITSAFGPGCYTAAVSLPGQTAAYLIPFAVVAEPASASFEEAIAKRAQARRALEQNALAEAALLLEECASLYNLAEVFDAAAEAMLDAAMLHLQLGAQAEAAKAFRSALMHRIKAGDEDGARFCRAQVQRLSDSR